MNVANTRLCLLLHSIPDIDDNALARLLSYCGSPRAAVECDHALWHGAGLSGQAAQALKSALVNGTGDPALDIDAQLQALQTTGAEILPISDARYPPLLRTIHDPPPLLYVRGDIAVLAEAHLAMVGSRKASPAGLRAAGTLAGQLVQAGLGICSGLALGVDGAAHLGAVHAGGTSIAVMATGIDRIYPARHGALAAELEQCGCLVTEFPLGVPPLRQNFPRRNRIISGLALGVLVVEAAQPSGSLITARTAMEQGREVFALPWSIYHSAGAGCLGLIRDGVKMVRVVEDVLEELGPLYSLQQDLFNDRQLVPSDAPGISSSQQRVLDLVGYEVATVEELACHSALPVARLLAELSTLEVRGLIERREQGYIRC